MSVCARDCDLCWACGASAVTLIAQALMELGATVCTPKSPSCSVCPLQHMCAAYKQQQEWEAKRLELAKSAAKGFFSSTPAAKSAALQSSDDDQMYDMNALCSRLSVTI